MNWNLISKCLPEVKQTVLLHWPVPDMPPIYRLGCILHKPFGDDLPIWKFDLDYGDSGAWVFTNRDDVQPTHWAPINPPASDASPASSHPARGAIEAGATGNRSGGR